MGEARCVPFSNLLTGAKLSVLLTLPRGETLGNASAVHTDSGCGLGLAFPSPVTARGVTEGAQKIALDRPVVNKTNLQGQFAFRVKASEGAENDFLKRLGDQLSLTVTPAQRSVEIVVIEPR